MRQRTYVSAVAAVLLFCSGVRASTEIEAVSPEAFERILENEHGNIVVLNLWATWCAPCLVEIPDLLRLETDLADLGVKLIGLSVDEPRGGTDRIAAMRDRHFPDFRTYARDNTEVDYLISVVDPAWNEVVPTTYIIGIDGEVKTRIQGKKSLEEFKDAVKAVAE